jgi:hypothetical protein
MMEHQIDDAGDAYRLRRHRGPCQVARYGSQHQSCADVWVHDEVGGDGAAHLPTVPVGTSDSNPWTVLHPRKRQHYDCSHYQLASRALDSLCFHLLLSLRKKIKRERILAFDMGRES